MEFINLTQNTVYISDIDIDIPYYENHKSQNIELDKVKKSKQFRKMIELGEFKVIQCGNSLFERSLLQKNHKKQSINYPKEKVINSNNLNVKIKGHFYDAGGYAKVNRNMALGLSKLGINVSIDPVNKKLNHLNSEELNQLNSIQKPLSKKYILIDSMVPSFASAVGGHYKILNTTVESSTIPKQFLNCISNYNEIWVPSDFCKQILIKEGVSQPIFVFPNSFDTSIYNQDIQPYEFYPKLNPFVFISVFGWSWRKGYDALLKSYLKEFSIHDNISLLIVSRYQNKTSKNDVIKEEIKKYIDSYGKGKDSPHIARYSKVIPEKNMPSIYKACNAFVLLSRGEGFGNPYVEASLCGLPVIATNYSGHTMFLNKKNSYLIDIDKLSPVAPGLMHIHFWDNQKMASLTSDKFIQDVQKNMRYIYENEEKAKNKNKILSSLLSDNYNIEKISNDINKRLKNIWYNL